MRRMKVTKFNSPELSSRDILDHEITLYFYIYSRLKGYRIVIQLRRGRPSYKVS